MLLGRVKGKEIILNLYYEISPMLGATYEVDIQSYLVPRYQDPQWILKSKDVQVPYIKWCSICV